MGSIISSPRSMILEVATKFVTIDSELFANIIVRWKCLNTEFSAFLMRIGLGSVHRKTYRKVFQPLNPIDSHIILQAASEHKQNENALVQHHGPTILNMLFKQSYHLIQKVLEKDEVVLDYCYLGGIYNDEGTTSELYCGIVVIKPEGKPVIEIFDDNKAGYLSKQWHHLLTMTVGSSEEIKRISCEVCNLLFPLRVREVIESDKVKRIFLCPDLHISHLPLDLLTFPDGQMLVEKCVVALLSSCREIIRYDFVAKLDMINQLRGESDATSGSKCLDMNQDTTSSQRATSSQHATSSQDIATCDVESEDKQVSYIPPTDIHSHDSNTENSEKCQALINDGSQDEKDQSTSITKRNDHCVIIANPNFDLESGQVEKGGDLVNVVKDLLSALFQVPKTEGLAEPLPGTEEEARNVEQVLSIYGRSSLSVELLMGSSATIAAVLDVKSPFILHLATHGFAAKGNDSCQEPFGGNFWHSTSSGLLFAGANTYRSGKYNQVLTDAVLDN